MKLRTMALALTLGLAVAQPAWAGAVQSITVPSMDAAASAQAKLARDVQSVIEVMYADIERLKRTRVATTNRVVAIGAGAGLGYLVGGFLTGGFVNPAVASLATNIGFSPGIAGTLGSTVGTMGTFATTYAGAIAGDSLVD